MAATEVSLNLGSMIDLAIGTPEAGKIDFNVLQAVLHVLGQQLGALNKTVTIKPSLASGLNLTSPTGPRVTIDVKEFRRKGKKSSKNWPDNPEPTMVVVDRVTKDKNTLDADMKLAADIAKIFAAGLSEDVRGQDTTHILARCDNIQDKLNALMQRYGPGMEVDVQTFSTGPLDPAHKDQTVVARLLNCEKTLEEITGTVSKMMEYIPELSMYRTVMEEIQQRIDDSAGDSILTRIEVVEEALFDFNLMAQRMVFASPQFEKLQQKILEQGGAPPPEIGQSRVDIIGRRGPAVPPRAVGPPGAMMAPGAGPGGTYEQGLKHAGGPGTPITYQDISAIYEHLNNLHGMISQLSGGGRIMESYKEGYDFTLIKSTGEPGKAPTYEDICAICEKVNSLQEMMKQFSQSGRGMIMGAEMTTREEFSYLKPTGGPGIPPTYEDIRPIYEHLNNLQKIMERLPEAGRGKGESYTRGPGELEMLELMDRLNKMERAQEQCCESNEIRLNKIMDYVNYLEDQMAILVQKVAEVAAQPKLTPEYIKAIEEIQSLYDRLDFLNNQFDRVFKTADWLEAERDNRQTFMNDIIEQMEVLKSIKMDTEDTADALAMKADIDALKKKVDIETFEEAYEDLNAGLDKAIAKLEYQQSLWQQAIDDIQDAMKSKLNIVDLEPVKDYLYLKLKGLQENIKTLTNVRADVTTAGGKQMRDIKCFTCDANAIMKAQAVNICNVDPLPPAAQMTPKIVYELDMLRKKKAGGDYKRKSCHESPKMTKFEEELAPCMRWCGGSHTMTNPVQRIGRRAHFIQQWGRQGYPKPSTTTTGSDGKDYKITCETKDTIKPMPKPKSAIVSKLFPPLPKPVAIISECECFAAKPKKKM